jgi:Phosphotransacetylase
MDREHDKYERLIDFCRTHPPVTTAVAHPCDRSSLEGAIQAAELGLITPILVGPEARIRAVAEQAGLHIADFAIVDAAHSHAAAVKAVALVREGKAENANEGKPAHG